MDCYYIVHGEGKDLNLVARPVEDFGEAADEEVISESLQNRNWYGVPAATPDEAIQKARINHFKPSAPQV